MKFEEMKYQRIQYDEVAAKYNSLLTQLEKEEDGDAFLSIFKEIEKLNEEISTNQTLASVRHTINTKDEFYEKENDFWDETMPLLQVFASRLSKICLNFKDRNALLKFIPETYFQLAECQLKSFDEKIVPLLQQENKLTTEYGKLKATAQIEFDGKTYNLSTISPLCEDADRDIRKRANAAKNKFFEENENEFDRIYDELVKVRDKIAKELGYQSFTEVGYYRMNRLDYNQEMVAAYRQQILEDIVPIDRELHEKQAKRLGLEKLAYYDESILFTSGNPKPAGDESYLVEKAVKMYHEMSKETGEFIDVMNDNHLWDLASRDGKEMGGYTTSIFAYKVPFIFANFNGTSGDVDVLTHEAGHAFQYYMSRDIPVADCTWPTLESCEIHSMSMEFFAYPWAKDFFGKDTDKYYFTHFTSTLEFLPYGVLVDHFQHEVYNHPEMTPAERKATWRKLEKMYLPDRDYSESKILERGTYWYKQGHIFQSPFYYIDYTLAQVCALQFWARNYSKDPDAFKDYLHLCTLGGTKSFTKLVKEANLISPFEKGCVKDVASKAKEFINSINDLAL